MSTAVDDMHTVTVGGPYMGNALSAETRSITTGRRQTLYLDEKDQALLTEGDEARDRGVIALGHLPLFPEGDG